MNVHIFSILMPVLPFFSFSVCFMSGPGQVGFDWFHLFIRHSQEGFREELTL